MILHPTWHDLAYKGTDDLGREDKFEYLDRITNKYPNLPAPVLEQWTYLHHRNSDMQRLYGWIDYSKVKFDLQSWTTDQILRIKPVSSPEARFDEYVDMTEDKIKSTKSLKKEYSEEIVNHWIDSGTWRTPIIVLNTQEIRVLPQTIKLQKPYQLIEGHTRLGWFKAFNSFPDLQHPYRLANNHQIWLMSLDTQ